VAVTTVKVIARKLQFKAMSFNRARKKAVDFIGEKADFHRNWV